MDDKPICDQACENRACGIKYTMSFDETFLVTFYRGCAFLKNYISLKSCHGLPRIPMLIMSMSTLTFICLLLMLQCCKLRRYIRLISSEPSIQVIWNIHQVEGSYRLVDVVLDLQACI